MDLILPSKTSDKSLNFVDTNNLYVSQMWTPIDFNIFITSSAPMGLLNLMFNSGVFCLTLDFTTSKIYLTKIARINKYREISSCK